MTDASPRFRSVLDTVPVYKPGRVPVSSSGQTHKLSSNETPFAPLPSVVDAIAEAARSVHRYPDNGAQALIGAIADKFGVPAEHVAVGCGSVGVTQQLLAAIGEPGAEVMYAWRSFEAYPILADLTGAESVRVPLRDDTHDLDAMAAAISPRTRLIFVCNPNNPTGTVVHTAKLEAFLDQVPAGCLVVLDEAYREYVRDEAVPDGLGLYRDRPNVAVLRTFSKAYGLAGLRTGFMIAPEPVAAAARTTMLPFSVNSIAQAAAIASLAAEDELFERVEHTVKERTRVREALVADGWEVPPTEANFVWLGLGEHTLDFAAACFDEGIAIRPFAGDGARISIGDTEANDAFLAVAHAYPHRTGLNGRDRPGISSSAQAASHSVLTVTRIRFAAGGTGGQNQNSWLPSGLPPPSPGMARCSAPVSSVARTPKDGAIIGQYSPMIHGCPYSWMVTSSSCAAMLSITAVARRSGRVTASPARSGSLSRARRYACRAHRCASSSCQPKGTGRSDSTALSGGSAPVHSSASATAATIFALSSCTLASPVAIDVDGTDASSAR